VRPPQNWKRAILNILLFVGVENTDNQEPSSIGEDYRRFEGVAMSSHTAISLMSESIFRDTRCKALRL
jgi:hypothetical protein